MVTNPDIVSFVATPIDLKTTGFAKVVFGLRQDLDIHTILAVNWNKIKGRSLGLKFFSQVRHRALDSIVLGVCKIYEEEKRNELNSIDGVITELNRRGPKVLDDAAVNSFLATYQGSKVDQSPTGALRSSFEEFTSKFSGELESFRTARDKVIAHSEYDVLVKSVPSYDAMESLFYFASDFYTLVGSSFVGFSPDDLRTNRPIRSSLLTLLEEIGLSNVKSDME